MSDIFLFSVRPVTLTQFVGPVVVTAVSQGWRCSLRSDTFQVHDGEQMRLEVTALTGREVRSAALPHPFVSRYLVSFRAADVEVVLTLLQGVMDEYQFAMGMDRDEDYGPWFTGSQAHELAQYVHQGHTGR